VQSGEFSPGEGDGVRWLPRVVELVVLVKESWDTGRGERRWGVIRGVGRMSLGVVRRTPGDKSAEEDRMACGVNKEDVCTVGGMSVAVSTGEVGDVGDGEVYILDGVLGCFSSSSMTSHANAGNENVTTSYVCS
jgi:hypothetical protein